MGIWALTTSTAVVGLGSTSVASSLPRIVADLNGSQGQFGWIFSVTVLAAAVFTPVWGRLADLADHRLLLQAAVIVFTLGSALAGTAGSVPLLIGYRVIQGAGVGGVFTLCAVVVADIAGPRERGAAMGVLGAAQSLATLAGPVVGGLITDSPLGWRWNFYVAVPVAVAALVAVRHRIQLLQPVRVTTVERSRKTLSDSTVRLALGASAAIGMVMFSAGLFLTEYLQIVLGRSPTASSMLSIPMTTATVVAALLAGRVVSRSGRYRVTTVVGGMLMLLGAAALAGAAGHHDVPMIVVCGALIGAGIGAVQQNLVVVGQNAVPADLVAGVTAAVTFVRMIGGATAAAGLSALLGVVVAGPVGERVSLLPAKDRFPADRVPDVAALDEMTRAVVQQAYAHGMMLIFLIEATFAAVVVICALLLPDRARVPEADRRPERGRAR